MLKENTTVLKSQQVTRLVGGKGTDHLQASLLGYSVQQQLIEIRASAIE